MHLMEPQLRERLEAFKNLKVKHPRLEEMDRALTRAIHEHTSYTLLALYGPSGVGKSTVMKRVAKLCREEETSRSVVPVVVVQASPEDIGASARLDYYRQVLLQLRGHVAVKDRLMNLALANKSGKKSTDPAEWLDMREAVEYAFDLLGVKTVFVDEAQHLMYVDTPHKPAAQLDWLKSLTNRTNVLHVLVGNFDLYDFCHLNGQAARRMRDLHFPRYHFDNKTECEEFVGVLRLLLERVPLDVDVPGLLSHWRWFGEWSLGCIGILGDWMVETVVSLCKEGETTLTLEAMKRHALQADQRLRLEMEARTGEYKIERAKAQSEQELQQLLGKPATTSSTVIPALSTNGVLPSSTVPSATSPSSRRKRIERAPNRDLVGDQIAVGNAMKCSFSGLLEIESKLFLESGISRGECPECAAMRQIQLRSEALRFPSHDQRKTRTPQTDRRWAKRETAWEVVGG
ncbi:MAG: ATP-binding protein [Ktedonobacteraceae bacterium]